MTKSVTKAALARTRDRLPEPTEAVANILKVYDLATEAEKAAGAAWYQSVNALVGNDSNRAGCLAALSPSTPWDQNVEMYLNVAAGREELRQSGLFLQRAKDCLTSDPGSVLGGPKVRNFWRNIADPAHCGFVTIDRHALSIVFGGVGEQASGPHSNKVGRLSDAFLKRAMRGRGTYTYLAAFYRSAARQRGLVPCQLQAVTWLVWRRLTDNSNPAGLTAAQLEEEF